MLSVVVVDRKTAWALKERFIVCCKNIILMNVSKVSHKLYPLEFNVKCLLSIDLRTHRNLSGIRIKKVLGLIGKHINFKKAMHIAQEV